MRYLSAIFTFAALVTFISVVYSEFFFSLVYGLVLGPQKGPEPAFGLGAFLVPFLVSAVVVLIITSLFYFLISLFLFEYQRTLFGLLLLFMAFVLAFFVFPYSRNLSSQKRFLEYLRSDRLAKVGHDEFDVQVLYRNFRSDSRLRYKNANLFLSYALNNQEIRSLLESEFGKNFDFRFEFESAMTLLSFDSRLNPRLISRAQGEALNEYMENSELLQIQVEGRNYQVELVPFGEDESPLLTLVNVWSFGKDKIGLHFKLEKSKKRVIVFVPSPLPKYNKKYKSVYSDPIIWNESE